jgi:hypothetical protein
MALPISEAWQPRREAERIKIGMSLQSLMQQLSELSGADGGGLQPGAHGSTAAEGNGEKAERPSPAPAAKTTTTTGKDSRKLLLFGAGAVVVLGAAAAGFMLQRSRRAAPRAAEELAAETQGERGNSSAGNHADYAPLPVPNALNNRSRGREQIRKVRFADEGTDQDRGEAEGQGPPPPQFDDVPRIKIAAEHTL